MKDNLKDTNTLFVNIPDIAVRIGEDFYRARFNSERGCYEILDKIKNFKYFRPPLGVSGI